MKEKLYEIFNPDEENRISDYLELVTGLSSAFATANNLEETIHTSLKQIMVYLQAEAASLFLLDDDGERVICRASEGPIDIAGLEITINQGIVGRVIRTGLSELVADVAENQAFTTQVDEATGFITSSILCAPLRIGKKCIGALEAVNKLESDAGFAEKDRCVLSALASSAALAIHNAHMMEQRTAQERLNHDLELASAIQRSFFPTSPGDQFPIQGLNIPAYGISGDFFDIFELPNGTLFFALGDVTGKGIHAALLTAKTSSLMRHLCQNTSDPGTLLAIVNQELAGSGSMGNFVTTVAGFYDPSTNKVQLANAGHPAPLLQLSDNEIHAFPKNSLPLGIMEHTEFPNVNIDLNGGTLVIYSDGLTDTPDANGIALDEEGLKEQLLQSASLPVSQRLKQLTAPFEQQHENRFDDITILIISS